VVESPKDSLGGGQVHTEEYLLHQQVIPIDGVFYIVDVYNLLKQAPSSVIPRSPIPPTLAMAEGEGGGQHQGLPSRKLRSSKHACNKGTNKSSLATFVNRSCGVLITAYDPRSRATCTYHSAFPLPADKVGQQQQLAGLIRRIRITRTITGASSSSDQFIGNSGQEVVTLRMQLDLEGAVSTTDKL
jgi:hypothetical protein